MWANNVKQYCKLQSGNNAKYYSKVVAGNNVKHYSKTASGHKVRTYAMQCRIILKKQAIKKWNSPQLSTILHFWWLEKFGAAVTSTLKKYTGIPNTVIFRRVREGTGQITADQNRTISVFRSDVDVNDDEVKASW